MCTYFCAQFSGAGGCVLTSLGAAIFLAQGNKPCLLGLLPVGLCSLGGQFAGGDKTIVTIVVINDFEPWRYQPLSYIAYPYFGLPRPGEYHSSNPIQ